MRRLLLGGLWAAILLLIFSTHARASDRLLVRFRPGVAPAEQARLHREAGAVWEGEIAPLRVQVVRLAGQIPAGRALGWYRARPQVEFAEPDALLEPAAVYPDDPYFAGYQDELALLGAPAAWELTTGSPEVLVAVLDTGVELSHPDLAGRLVSGWDFVQGDADPSDVYGHGTMVTGVLGAATDNALGVAGVSWHNPVLEVRVGGDSGSASISALARGTIYAADRGARAINISFTTSAYSQTLADAVAYAWGKGALVVAGAGNSGDGTRPWYPAALPYVIGVSGVEGDTLSPYSNYGSWVDVCAPFSCYTTVMGGGYRHVQGTSFSGPFVVGLLGLVFSMDPSLSPQEAVDLVCANADDLGAAGFDPLYGWGRINLYRTLQAAAAGGTPSDGTPPTVEFTEPAAGAFLRGPAAIQVSAGDDNLLSRVDLQINGAQAGSLTQAPFAWTWNTAAVPDGPYTLAAVAVDAAGNQARAERTVTVDNTPPTTSLTSPLPGATVSGTVAVTAAAGDTGSGVAQVSFYLDGTLQYTDSAGPYQWSWNAAAAVPGSHALLVRARDRAGNEAVGGPVTVQVAAASVTETFSGAVSTAGIRSMTYQVMLAEAGEVWAVLSFAAPADLDLALYAGDGRRLAVSAARRGTTETIRYQAQVAGRYRLVVTARKGGSSYTLQVTHP